MLSIISAERLSEASAEAWDRAILTPAPHLGGVAWKLKNCSAIPEIGISIADTASSRMQ
jgi:hypothetical protein